MFPAKAQIRIVLDIVVVFMYKVTRPKPARLHLSPLFYVIYKQC